MATSNEDELITQTNHIINAIEDHENRITRHEDDIKRLVQHIDKLEKELIITQDLQMIVARIFSVKTQATSIQNHLENIEIGLYNLLKNQLTPHLIRFETIQKGLEKLRNTVVQKGYLLATYDANEALQLQSSFVSMTNGSIYAILHIPVYKSVSTLYIYKYIPLPIASNGEGSTMIIEPDQRYIAVSLKDELHIELRDFDLEHQCMFIKDTFFCKGTVLKKGSTNSCLHALYKNELDRIGETCPVNLFNADEYVTQLNSTTFVVYGKTPKRIYIICTDQNGQKVYEKSTKLTGTNYIKIYRNCELNLKSHFLSSSLPFTLELETKLVESDLQIEKLLSLGKEEMENFLRFVRKGLETKRRSIHINEAKQKFDLKMIQGHSSLLSKIFTYTTSVIGIVIAAMILIATIKAFRKYRSHQAMSQQPMVKINFRSLMEKAEINSDTGVQTESEGEMKKDEYVTLRG